jgi:hypothetical protein
MERKKGIEPSSSAWKTVSNARSTELQAKWSAAAPSSHALPRIESWEDLLFDAPYKSLILLVGAPGLEPGTR